MVGMKVLEVGEKRIWKKIIDCKECNSTLEIVEGDLQARNYAVGYAGETWEPGLFVICAICRSSVHLKDSDVPSGIINSLFEQLKKR